MLSIDQTLNLQEFTAFSSFLIMENFLYIGLHLLTLDHLKIGDRLYANLLPASSNTST
jgi:hypothetical protein